ncbi:MAG TPA: SMC-Scp complex subunit ScpB [Planctomycetota bacterium]|nr:SMC-Scp complex subunit ScpB [Planctomycetota bacterium]
MSGGGDPAAGERGEAAPAAGAAPAPAPRQVLEALLFAADAPLPLDRLREAAGIEDARAARDLLDGLRAEYESGGRAFSLEEVAGGWQVLTRAAYAPWIARLHRRPERARLTQAALETLAVVAYRQPVLRTDVERVRGVACGDTLRALMERDLVRVAGRAEEPGSPLLYGTTPRFLAEFGLRGLKDLPTAKDLPPPPGTKVAGA